MHLCALNSRIIPPKLMSLNLSMKLAMMISDTKPQHVNDFLSRFSWNIHMRFGFCKKYCEIIPEHGVTGTVGMRVDVYMWRLQ